MLVLSCIHYNQFKIGSTSEKYKLTVGGYTGGDGSAGDGPASNRMFTALDSDNDLHKSANYAVGTKSGWWYSAFYDINPNIQPPHYDFPKLLPILR